MPLPNDSFVMALVLIFCEPLSLPTPLQRLAPLPHLDI